MKIFKIIVDMGHTLEGLGTGAVKLVKETDKNREVGKRLIAMLKEHGHIVINATVDVSSKNLEDRVRIANQHPDADLFISLHLNASKDALGHGVETWIYTGSAKSKNIAESVQKELVTAIGWRDRGVKEGSWYVVRYTTMPAILVELGFCDNQSDMYKWNTEKIAMSLFKGITGTVYTPKVSKLYCVQVGAYSVRSNATNMLNKIKAAGFDAYITEK